MSELRVRDLTVAYGQAVALDGVSLVVPNGQIACILGSNGAGKSSFLRTIVGLVHARAGTIFIDGDNITNVPSWRAAASGVALSPEGRRLFPELSVYDNLCVGGYLRRRDRVFRDDLDAVFDYFPRLRKKSRQAAGTLSGGEQQMVAIGRALMAKPKLLLLDEPSLGLAPLIVQQLADIIKRLNVAGLTIMLVEQNARMALQIANYGYVLETGKLALEGSGSSLLENPLVAKLYLGRE